jgi:rubrerythrin
MAGNQIESEIDIAQHPWDSLFQIAVEIEQGGIDFYAQIADQSDDPRIKNEIHFLRDEEVKHKAFFEAQLEAAGHTGELTPVLRNWLEAAFSKPIRAILTSQAADTNRKALQLGVKLEQKTIDLYKELKGRIPDDSAKRDLDRIISEEEKHKKKLTLLLAY